MGAWYEAESELETLLEGEGVGEAEFGWGARRVPVRGRWTPRPIRPARLAPIARQRFPPMRRHRPWLIYGAIPRVYSHGSPVYQSLSGTHLPTLALYRDAAPEPASEPPEELVASPEEQGEYETKAQRGPHGLTLKSWDSRTFTGFPPKNIPSGGGLYIVVQDNLPIYVGETDSFHNRWAGRLRAMFQIGITDEKGRLPAPIKVWFGTIDVNTEPARKTVEHAIIRTLILADVVPPIHPKEAAARAGRPKLSNKRLRNATAYKPFHAAGRILIKNILPPVAAWQSRASAASDLQGLYAGNTITLNKGSDYELFFE